MRWVRPGTGRRGERRRGPVALVVTLLALVVVPVEAAHGARLAESSPVAPAGRPAAGSGVSEPITVAQGVTCSGPDQRTVARLRAAIVARRQAGTAITVHDLRTQTWCGYRETEMFVTASIVKASTVAALMWKRQKQGRSLSADERSWAASAIRVSSNAAQTSLWNALGRGPEYLRFARAIGMTSTTTDPGGRWGLTRTTTRDQVRFLDELATGTTLTAANRGHLLALMRSVTASQRWGVPRHAPSGDLVAVKNGWLPYGGSWRVNSIGYVTGAKGSTATQHYTVAVLSTGSGSMSTGVARVSAAARAAHDAL